MRQQVVPGSPSEFWRHRQVRRRHAERTLITYNGVVTAISVSPTPYCQTILPGGTRWNIDAEVGPDMRGVAGDPPPPPPWWSCIEQCRRTLPERERLIASRLADGQPAHTRTRARLNGTTGQAIARGGRVAQGGGAAAEQQAACRGGVRARAAANSTRATS